MTTYDYLQPTEKQLKTMALVRGAAKVFGDVLVATLPEGPDKEFVIRNHRTTAMWANTALLRLPSGAPRGDEK